MCDHQSDIVIVALVNDLPLLNLRQLHLKTDVTQVNKLFGCSVGD